MTVYLSRNSTVAPTICDIFSADDFEHVAVLQSKDARDIFQHGCKVAGHALLDISTGRVIIGTHGNVPVQPGPMIPFVDPFDKPANVTPRPTPNFDDSVRGERERDVPKITPVPTIRDIPDAFKAV